MTDKIPPGVPDDRIWHIMPVGDLREHDAFGAGGTCWCNPEIACEPHGWVVLHISMDGREAFEQGRRRLS